MDSEAASRQGKGRERGKKEAGDVRRWGREERARKRGNVRVGLGYTLLDDDE